jgi:hypothetical protein
LIGTTNRKSTFSSVAVTGAAAVVAGALLAGTATSAQAAPTSGTTQVGSVQAKQAAAKARTRQLSAYPLTVTAVSRFRLSPKQVKEVAAARHLANSGTAKMIRNRESGGNYAINTGNGYYGAYQFDRSTWLSNGGGQFARTADKAPKWAQDYIVYRTHKARGWSPWAM